MAPASEMPAAALMLPLRLAGYQEERRQPHAPQAAGGTITLFAFDEGQSLSEHTAPFDAVAQVLEGEAEITIAGTPLNVAAEELVLMLGGLQRRTEVSNGLAEILFAVAVVVPSLAVVAGISYFAVCLIRPKG